MGFGKIYLAILQMISVRFCRILKPAIIQNGNKQLPKLYRVKGKSVPALIEMNGLTWDNFRSCDVFIIKTPQTVFVWVGRAANVEEKRHATIVRTSTFTLMVYLKHFFLRFPKT